MSQSPRELIPVPIAVMTVSDSRTEADDKSGKLLVDRLISAGHSLVEKVIVPDDVFQIRAVASRWIADPAVQVVLMTGGTGVTGFDGTPEAVRPLFEKVLDGFGEIFRAISFEEIATSSLQSRAICGLKLDGIERFQNHHDHP
ncbi:MAG: molybdenum cofactor biosynthesis protein [Gammaproteobacteria bacterium]|nr:molybdenum cofactor biosynthesis protein [Gammaproteobacteria bacterium]